MLMMLPFEAPTIFEGIHKSYFRMPRVVKDQRSKFENDDLFRQLSHESAVKYTGFKDRPLEERQMKFLANCQEGTTEVSVLQTGNQFTLMFDPRLNPSFNNEGFSFEKDNKVHLKARFILNGVCVVWHGWIDVQRLEGFGCLDFDEFTARDEESLAKQQATCNNQPTANNHLASPLSHLAAAGNHHPNPFGGPQFGPAGALSSIPGAGLLPPGPVGHPGLGGPPTQPGVGAPSLMGDSYGNSAAIAAAAAAAFHQALNGPPGLGAPPSVVAAAAAAASADNSLLSQAAPHLSTFANGLMPSLPHTPPTRQQAIKRPPSDEQNHSDDVDVVSDIQAHDLDFPPRRIFKSAPTLSAVPHHNHHHHHRAARRAV